jgi:Flp pilus assembly protein TadB
VAEPASAPQRSGVRHLARAAAAHYDTAPAGRRLAAKLWAAQIDAPPSAWRCVQLALALPAGMFLLAAGMGGVAAAMAAISISRAGGRAVLWARRHRGRAAIEAAAPSMARALSTELAAWGSATQALVAATPRCASSPAATRVLELAAARVALGGDAALSLRRALVQLDPRLPGTSSAAIVSAIFALHHYDAAATATALDSLATAIEDDRAVRREARAGVAEQRMSAVAVPAIAAATGAMLLASDPAALAAALSMPLLPLLLAAVVVVVLAALVTRRLMSV